MHSYIRNISASECTFVTTCFACYHISTHNSYDRNLSGLQLMVTYWLDNFSCLTNKLSCEEELNLKICQHIKFFFKEHSNFYYLLTHNIKIRYVRYQYLCISPNVTGIMLTIGVSITTAMVLYPLYHITSQKQDFNLVYQSSCSK